MSLVDAVLTGDRLALARLLTHIENETRTGREGLDRLFRRTGSAHLVGVTGSPGTGKSSLVGQLAFAFRHPVDDCPPRRVGIVAVDPSSPFSGGALLGDRVRMRDLAGDPGVFIRSMASRGNLGGLARNTAAVVQALDAAGYEIILIETVGAGQAEVEIASLAQTTIVVEAPGLGDDIQAIKAGILEIADILVVNKADQPGVENAERALRSMLELAFPEWEAGDNDQHWVPYVLRTVATRGEGIREVVEIIDNHARFLKRTGKWQSRERARLSMELSDLLQDLLVARWKNRVGGSEFDQAVDRLCRREISPYQAAALLAEMKERAPAAEESGSGRE